MKQKRSICQHSSLRSTFIFPYNFHSLTFQKQLPHEVPELASSDDEDSSSESDESDDNSDDDDEHFWGMSSRMLGRAPPAPQHPSPPNTPQPQRGRPTATTAPPALVAVPPPARSEVVPMDPRQKRPFVCHASRVFANKFSSLFYQIPRCELN